MIRLLSRVVRGRRERSELMEIRVDEMTPVLRACQSSARLSANETWIVDVLIAKQQPADPCAQREAPDKPPGTDKLALIHISIPIAIRLFTVGPSCVVIVPGEVGIGVILVRMRTNKRFRGGIAHVSQFKGLMGSQVVECR